MSVVFLEFRIKRGIVNREDIDDPDLLNAINQTIELILNGDFEGARNKLPQMFFEWIPSNGDCDASEMFRSSENFKFDLSEDNSDIKLGVRNKELVLTTTVFFELTLIEAVDKEVLAAWLDNNSMYFCGYVGGGWIYHGDDGCSLSVLKID